MKNINSKYDRLQIALRGGIAAAVCLMMLLSSGCVSKRVSVTTAGGKPLPAEDGRVVLIPASGVRIMAVDGDPCDNAKLHFVNPLHFNNCIVYSENEPGVCCIMPVQLVSAPIVVPVSIMDWREELRCVVVSPGERDIDCFVFKEEHTSPNTVYTQKGKVSGRFSFKPDGFYVIGYEAPRTTGKISARLVASEDVPEELKTAVRRALANPDGKIIIDGKTFDKFKGLNPNR